MTDYQKILIKKTGVFLMSRYLFRFASDENGQDLWEEAGQEWIERWLILEEAVQFLKQLLILP